MVLSARRSRPSALHLAPASHCALVHRLARSLSRAHKTPPSSCRTVATRRRDRFLACIHEERVHTVRSDSRHSVSLPWQATDQLSTLHCLQCLAGRVGFGEEAERRALWRVCSGRGCQNAEGISRLLWRMSVWPLLRGSSAYARICMNDAVCTRGCYCRKGFRVDACLLLLALTYTTMT